MSRNCGTYVEHPKMIVPKLLLFVSLVSSPIQADVQKYGIMDVETTDVDLASLNTMVDVRYGFVTSEYFIYTVQ